MTDFRMQISFSIAENVSLAFYQNAVSFLRELAITNETGNDLSDVSVRLTSEPPFLTSRLWRVDSISDKASHHIRPLDLKLDPTFLSGLTAARRAEIRLFVDAANERVAERNLEINLLPPSHWGGMSAAPELLAAFVRPNDPSVDVILREAADKLAQAGRDPAIDGYRQRKKARAWEIAEAIWTALVARSIAYVLPPKSFERHGQQIRGPSEILARQVGTCLDLSLLYAACVEQAGLNPLIVLTEGHAFTGVWLVDEDFSEVTVDDAQALRKRVQLQELALVETTLLTGSRPSRFKHAVEQGGQQIAEDTAPVLELAIDVRRARAAGIKPMDLGAAAEPATEAKVAAVAEQALEDTPRFDEEFDTRGQQDAKPIDRLEGWKHALLDLSLRNRLLNFKEGKNVIPLECPAPAKLEDMLAAGREFKLLGRATVLDGKDGRDPGIFANTFKEDGRKSFLLEAIEREEIHTRMLEADLEARLTDLFRTARLAFEEGGANVLYLCLGFLKWSPKDGAGPYRAPLILVPVSLERKSIRSGFRLKLHEDETRFNPTLLQMLRQDFELSAPELDGDLPRDASGTDVIGVWRILQKHVRPIKGWEVIEDVALATLSFTKYLLWKDLVDRADELKRNPIVKHLIDTPTHSFEGSSGDFVEPTSLDTAVDPAELFTPLSADSSQLAAVVSAQRGKDFVLFGPPGTGKSQTIANMIANCLAHGKTVLFVSQKTAALEVVRRRLDDIGIGDYCLEVHSTKAQKSSVVAQLANAWRERCCTDDAGWQAATAQLGAMRNELNRLVSALHRRRSNGMTAYEAFGRVIASREFHPEVGLSWPRDINHDPQTLAALSAATERLAIAVRGVGDPATHPLKGLRQTRWTPAWRDETTVAIDRLHDAVQILRRSVEAFAASIGLDQHVMGLAHVPELLKLGAALTAFDAVDCATAAALLRDDTKSAIEQGLGELKSLSDRARALRKEMDASYAPAVLRLDFNQLESDWNAACGANFFVREGRKGKVRQQLQPYCETPPQDIARDIVRLRDLASIASRADDHLKIAFAGVDRLCRGLDTDVGAIEHLVAWSLEMREAVRSFATESDDASWLLDHVALLLADYPHLLAARGAAREAFDAAQATWADAQSAIAELARCAGCEDVVGFVESRADWDEELLDRSARWRAYLIQAPEWANWRAVAAEATQLGLGPLVNWIEASVVPIESIRPAFEFSYARWFAEKVVNEDEVLSSFLAVRHEAAIDAFIKADKRVAELSKEIIRARIGSVIPTRTNFGADPEWGTLARETQKRTQHMPLRQLFARIPNALTKLTPCLMMSPLSIAQYLPPGARPFDVVIFDEASQIQVCDAIGAIARGNQAIIVGDPEQLPPTSVGERVIDVDDDRAVVPSQKSILDECLASNIPAMRLRWHYRSRHESLIAFSNAKYYKGELVTFPSPVTRDDAVHFIHVPDGVYERGGSKTNRKEAQAVVDEVVRRLKSADCSIGVVTFNAEQQKLIENQLDQARRSDPSLERFFDAKQVSEPALVKNIENIQGDERDVIIFSVAVGPDQTGRVTAQISSLNSEGGHRRLNVAITRARRELLVYSTLRPEQIDLGRTSAKGVVDFKHFLEFARKGTRAIAESFSPTGGETESPFEAGVKRALELKGWEVHPQIGVSFFRIDLGVVHPDEPGRYLAGVECDGATYHRSATARDRDRLREWVLTDLGWRIRRIWSTDWWMNPAAALERLHARLEQDLAEDRAAALEKAEVGADPAGPSDAERPASEAPPLQATPEPLAPEMDEARIVEQAPAKAYADKVRLPQKDAEMVYLLSDPSAVASPDQSRFYHPDYRPVLREMIDHVATVEGPLFFDILVDRISRAHGFRRSADRIQGIVKTALVSSRLPVTREGDREVVWPPGADPLGLRPYRKGQRDHADIPLPELASLAAQFLRDGLEGELLVREIQDHFGLGRLFTSTRERFEAAIQLALRDEEQRKDTQS
jgi:very-short-patch-repair endonuclease